MSNRILWGLKRARKGFPSVLAGMVVNLTRSKAEGISERSVWLIVSKVSVIYEVWVGI
jgi:hypothetical protein